MNLMQKSSYSRRKKAIKPPLSFIILISLLNFGIYSKPAPKVNPVTNETAAVKEEDPAPETKAKKEEKKLTPELIAKKNEILTKIMKYGTANERRDAIRAIVDFDERVPLLVQLTSDVMMKDFDQSLRITAINALVKMENRTEEKNYYKLLEDENEDMVLQAIYAIGRLELTGGIDPLLTFIKTRDLKKNQNVTVSSIESLSKTDTIHKSYPYLVEQFKNHDNNAQIRAQIALYFGSTMAKQSETLMLDTANDSKEETTIRCYAINTLAKIGAKSAVPHLKKILDETRKDRDKTGIKQNQTLKIYTLSALVKLGDSSVKQELFAFSKDNDAVVRLRAIKFLEDLDDPDVIELLEYKAQRDPSNKVQEAAKNALKKLGKELK